MIVAEPTYKELLAQLEALKKEVEKAEKAKQLLCETEEVLAEREALLHATIESLPFELFAKGKDGRYILDNQACRDVYGGAIIGKQSDELEVHPETLQLWEENNERAFAGETVHENVSFEVNDVMRHYTNIISPIRKGDEIIGIVGINIDIGEKVQLQVERVLLEQSLWDVFNYMKFFVLILDGERRIKKANIQIAKALGFQSVDDIIGRNWEDFIPELQQDAHLLMMDKIQRNLTEDREMVHDLINVKGERLSVRWFHSPANGDWVLSIGLPMLYKIKPTDTIEAMRAYWAESLSRDRTMISALKHIAEEEWKQRKAILRDEEEVVEENN